mmetsp:Transcript_14814/g.48529  ORF Transcript_14814/g.48529 Transcript_14814/m.48529 type:complete len:261 (-) Transcript_14814:86-868(-)
MPLRAVGLRREVDARSAQVFERILPQPHAPQVVAAQLGRPSPVHGRDGRADDVANGYGFAHGFQVCPDRARVRVRPDALLSRLCHVVQQAHQLGEPGVPGCRRLRQGAECQRGRALSRACHARLHGAARGGRQRRFRRARRRPRIQPHGSAQGGVLGPRARHQVPRAGPAHGHERGGRRRRHRAPRRRAPRARGGCEGATCGTQAPAQPQPHQPQRPNRAPVRHRAQTRQCRHPPPNRSRQTLKTLLSLGSGAHRASGEA